MLCTPQTTSNGGAPPAETLWDHLVAFASAPGVLEATLSIGLVGGFVFVWWRLAGLVQNVRERAALEDYLLGVEQALQGDLRGADKRLRRVLELDPDNHFARLMLGKVLGDLGEAEQAHQQHLYLKRAFAVESAENELLLAQSLLAAELPEEAVEVAQQAMQRMPGNTEGWEFLYRAQLQQGALAGAAETGRKLIASLAEPSQRTRWRSELASTFTALADSAWRTGDHRAAAAAAKEAKALDASQRRLPLLEARIEGARRDVAVVAKELAATGSGRELVPAAPGGEETAGREVAEPRLPTATFSGLVELERWTCRACGAPLSAEVLRCARCGAAAPAELVEPLLVEAIAEPAELMDRIDVNDAHVRRLVRALEAGDDRARGDLVLLADAAVPELLRAAWKGPERTAAAAILTLQEMGPTITPALFAAGTALSESRIWPVGEGPTAAISAVVQGFDHEALPFLQPLFATKRQDHQRVLVDYCLGLADLDAFQAVLERFPPMDILHRLNHAAAPVLTRFLAAVPDGHFLAESMLLEPTFYRDEALLAAVPEAAEPEVMVRVMLRRGPTRTVVSALIAGASDDALAATSMRVLEEFGAPVLEHCLAAFAGPELGDDARRRLARVIVRGGAEAAAHIADGFGPEAGASDDQLRELLLIIGDDAVQALVAAYERSGWLEKVSAGLVSRHNNRRVQIARTLGELGTKPATKALKRLLKQEKEDNLRMHLQRALHELGGGRG